MFSDAAKSIRIIRFASEQNIRIGKVGVGFESDNRISNKDRVMLIFQAIIDEDTCSVCKERNGKDVFYLWVENLFEVPEKRPCKNEICRCTLVYSAKGSE